MKDCNDKAACVGRREFLVKAGLVAGGDVLTLSSAGSVFAGTPFEDVVVPIAADSPLAKVGGSQVVDTSAGKVIVIRTSDAAFSAYSARCTHKGGLVNYDTAKKLLVCPKHGSSFDGANGKVVDGPADTPLASHAAKGSADKVTVTVGG